METDDTVFEPAGSAGPPPNYDPTQEEINELRQALVNQGYGRVPASNEALGIEYMDWVRRLIRRLASQ